MRSKVIHCQKPSGLESIVEVSAGSLEGNTKPPKVENVHVKPYFGSHYICYNWDILTFVIYWSTYSAETRLILLSIPHDSGLVTAHQCSVSQQVGV